MGIRPLRFGLGGAMTAGVLSGALSVAVRLAAGVPLPGDAVLAAGMWGVLVGGITAFGTIRLAQRAPGELRGTSGDLLGPGAGGTGNAFGSRGVRIPTRG